MAHAGTDWDEKLIGQLRALWVQEPRLSAAEIGRRMHVSKCAVLGKARRLNLPPRESLIRRGAGGGEAPHRREAGGRMAEPAGKLLPMVRVVEKPRPEPKGVSRPCCWPIGEPRAEDFRFCEARGVPGRPYCEAHMKVAYVSGPMRDETIKRWAREAA